MPAIEIDPISESHWFFDDFRQRVTRKQAQKILLNHATIIYRGRLYDIKAKSIGAGVYEIYKVLHKTS